MIKVWVACNLETERPLHKLGGVTIKNRSAASDDSPRRPGNVQLSLDRQIACFIDFIGGK